MANVLLARGSNSQAVHPSRRTASMPYAVERTVRFADAVTAKGSALATGDVLQVMVVPPYTICHGAIAEVLTVDSSTGATFDLDVGGGDDFVDGGNLNATGYVAPGSNGLLPFGSNSVQATSAADYIDMTLIVPGSVVPSNAVVRVVAFFTDVQANPGPAAAARTQL